MLVPAIQQYVVVLAPVPRQVDITMSKTQQGAATLPDGLRGRVQVALPGSAKSPPGPAKEMADCP